MLEDANGGFSYRSAYYLIYISEAEMLETKRHDVNRFEPSPAGMPWKHPYEPLSREKILKEILFENRRLMTEADEYRAVEIAKKVTTIYEKDYDDLKSFLNQRGIPVKDICSIYTFLLRSQ